MPKPIEIKIEDNEWQKVSGRLILKATNLRPLMKNISGIMKYSTERNFEEEGRPDKWPELSKSTIKLRTKKGHWPGKILQVRGELVSSITSKYDDNSAVVGTNKAYSAIHQLGGDAGRNKKVKIQARPYLKLDDKSLAEINKAAENYLQG